MKKVKKLKIDEKSSGTKNNYFKSLSTKLITNPYYYYYLLLCYNWDKNVVLKTCLMAFFIFYTACILININFNLVRFI